MRESTSETSAHLALYGSLMSRFDTQRELGIAHQLEQVGACQIRGDLFDLGEYPGVFAGTGVVHGELYRILDASVFEVLDPFEVFDPADPVGSLYQRVVVRLIDPGLDAWIYLLTARPDVGQRIPSGAWR